MRMGFLNSISMLLRGADVGLRPDYNLTGGIPPRTNREQRREEQRSLKRRLKRR